MHQSSINVLHIQQNKGVFSHSMSSQNQITLMTQYSFDFVFSSTDASKVLFFFDVEGFFFSMCNATVTRVN